MAARHTTHVEWWNGRRRTEIILLAAGVCLLGKAGWNALSYEAFQHHPEWFLQGNSANTGPGSARPKLPIAGNAVKPAPLQLLGRLAIPRLGMSVLVVEGDSEEKLSLGAGHVSGTAGLNASGNTVIAGHRDNTFRRLKKLKIGDRIEIRTDKSYEYLVKRIRVVNPDDVSVLQPTKKPVLTLITCYPFRFIGNAPKRFIVEAARTTVHD